MEVHVLDHNENKIGTTTSARARRLLKSKRAFIFCNEPFTIKLNQFKLHSHIPMGKDGEIGISNLSEVFKYKWKI
jgi:hypothetical protein